MIPNFLLSFYPLLSTYFIEPPKKLTNHKSTLLYLNEVASLYVDVAKVNKNC